MRRPAKVTMSRSMRRSAKVILILSASIAVAALGAACGTEKISVPQSDQALHTGAVLFSQRCSGCHTLSYAATHGSTANVRSAQFNNGPNFNVRCERPVTRVLYAIQNGGFSGAIMPQNVVVGQDAIDVAEFVATYAGRQTPKTPGLPVCASEQIGTLQAVAGASSTTGTSATGTPSKTASKVKAASAKPSTTTSKPGSTTPTHP